MAKAALKTLYLLRHAKAAPAEAGGEDRERPLTERGHEDAAEMGRHMAEAGYKPAVILCSPSRRTVETLEHILPRFATVQSLRHEESLYLATRGQLLAQVHGIADCASGVLIVGHNPGIVELALALAAPGKEARRMAEKFPTCALAVLEFKTPSWREAAPGEGHLRAFARPKDFSD